MSKQVKVTWIKSGIGAKAEHRRTIRALGLHRLHHSVVHTESDSVRGMLHAVRHMVRVEEISQ